MASPLQRQILARRLQGYKHTEIAADLWLKGSRVRSLCSRGVAVIRESLGVEKPQPNGKTPAKGRQAKPPPASPCGARPREPHRNSRVRGKDEFSAEELALLQVKLEGWIRAAAAKKMGGNGLAYGPSEKSFGPLQHFTQEEA